MANPQAIAGRNAFLYRVQPLYNKNTANASLGGAISLLGVGQELTIDITVNYAEATPSAQPQVERVYTGYDYSMTMKNIVRSGGGLLTYSVFDASIDTLTIFQEEYSGATMYIFASLETGSYKWGRDSRMEDLKFTNTGPIGTYGGGIFRLYAGGSISGGVTTSSIVPGSASASIQSLQAQFSSQSAIVVGAGSGFSGGTGL